MTRPSPATVTRKKKSEIFTRLQLDYERLVGRRLTVQLIQSPEWRELQKKYCELWLPLMTEAEKGTK